MVVSSYVIDQAGGSFPPLPMLVVAIGSGGLALFAAGRRAVWDRSETITFVAVLLVVFAWLLWIARPSLLPLGSGPDLTHHLLLIQYIERHWRLVHEPGAQEYLGEMVHYTPGSHVVTALVAAWTGRNGLHAVHAVMAGAAALKAGFVFLLGLRMLPRDLPRVPLALTGPIALFASQTYFLGSFVEYSFLAQVVAELFAVAMWWGLVVWDQQTGRAVSAFIGLAGAAVFLTWPIVIGPPMVLLAALVLLPQPVRFSTRLIDALAATAPILIVAWVFSMERPEMMRIAAVGGEAVSPTVQAYGWPFLVLSTVGILIATIGVVTTRTNRTLSIMTFAIGAQSAGLYVAARSQANMPYMAMKMFYMLLYPQAIGVAVAMGGLLSVARRIAPSRIAAEVFGRLAWVLPVLFLTVITRPLIGAPRSLRVGHHPATSNEIEAAGLWARDHLPQNCVEYLVPDVETAYWLHLAVMGNPRSGPRTADNATYQLTLTLVRWLSPGALPYAIADLPALPSGVRDELDVLASFGSAAVVKHRRSSSCNEQQERF